MVSAATQACSN
ncbi:hypothetical protein YPPY102_1411, partial [Yersinia pestis PY-102]